MAWSSPPVAVSNSLLTASYLNTYLRDNMLEMMAAKATTAGQTFSTAGVNDVRVVTESSAVLNVSQQREDTNYGDLNTVGPSVTVNTSTLVMVILTAQISNTGSGIAYAGYEVSGATSVLPSDTNAMSKQGADVQMFSHLIPHTTALVPGNNTFTMKYRSSTGTATFANRRITVLSF